MNWCCRKLHIRNIDAILVNIDFGESTSWRVDLSMWSSFFLLFVRQILLYPSFLDSSRRMRCYWPARQQIWSQIRITQLQSVSHRTHKISSCQLLATFGHFRGNKQSEMIKSRVSMKNPIFHFANFSPKRLLQSQIKVQSRDSDPPKTPKNHKTPFEQWLTIFGRLFLAIDCGA